MAPPSPQFVTGPPRAARHLGCPPLPPSRDFHAQRRGCLRRGCTGAARRNRSVPLPCLSPASDRACTPFRPHTSSQVPRERCTSLRGDSNIDAVSWILGHLLDDFDQHQVHDLFRPCSCLVRARQLLNTCLKRAVLTAMCGMPVALLCRPLMDGPEAKISRDTGVWIARMLHIASYAP